MSDSEKPNPVMTLGQAIDRLIESLSPLDAAARATALRTACDHLSIPLLSTGAEGNRSKPQAVAVEVSSTPSTTSTDIRQFKEEKSPGTANEMAAVVAFYLSELAPQPECKKDVDFRDMEQYFKQANFHLPKAKQQLLPNARNAGYFDALGKGRFRLNAVGYNLVAHSLPRSGAEGLSSSTGRRKPRVTRPRKTQKAQRTKKR